MSFILKKAPITNQVCCSDNSKVIIYSSVQTPMLLIMFLLFYCWKPLSCGCINNLRYASSIRLCVEHNRYCWQHAWIHPHISLYVKYIQRKMSMRLLYGCIVNTKGFMWEIFFTIDFTGQLDCMMISSLKRNHHICLYHFIANNVVCKTSTECVTLVGNCNRIYRSMYLPIRAYFLNSVYVRHVIIKKIK